MLRRPRNPLPSPPSLVNLSFFPSFLPLFSLLRCRLQRYYDPTSPQISRPDRQVPNVLTFSNFALCFQVPVPILPRCGMLSTPDRGIAVDLTLWPRTITLYPQPTIMPNERGELASAKARNSFHIFSIQRAKITSSLPPSFLQHGGRELQGHLICGRCHHA